MGRKLRTLMFGLAGAALGYGVGEFIEEETETTEVVVVDAATELGSVAVGNVVVVSDEALVTDEGLKEGLALIGFGAGVIGASGLISNTKRWYVDHGMSLRSGWTPEDGPSLREQQVERWKQESLVDGFSVTKTL